MKHLWRLWKRSHPTDIFSLLVALIVVISFYDGWLVWKFRQSIIEMEQNPILLWIIIAQGGKVKTALAVKGIGTACVAFLLGKLFSTSKRYAWPVVWSVAGFQLLLIVYLLLG